jgi:hypothetical protein
MAQNGGARPGAGRKPKADEIKLIESMDAIAAPDEVWAKLWELCKKGDTQAVKTWLNYRFGMPKQNVDVTTQGEKIAPIIEWIKSDS